MTTLRDEQAQLIANHLAAAYRLSGEDFLKLLLNQQSPELLERMLRYHRYFSAARTETLTEYQETLTDIEANAAAKQAREQALARAAEQISTVIARSCARSVRPANVCSSSLQGDMQDKVAGTQSR